MAYQDSPEELEFAHDIWLVQMRNLLTEVKRPSVEGVALSQIETTMPEVYRTVGKALVDQRKFGITRDANFNTKLREVERRMPKGSALFQTLCENVGELAVIENELKVGSRLPETKLQAAERKPYMALIQTMIDFEATPQPQGPSFDI